VSDESKIVKVYNAADVFVLPSLEDNLPNTIMEAMACGVPCVGFNIGGIPEMIGHLKSGYVAKAADADDLARGIKWVLDFKGEELSKEARRKVLNSYSQQSVAIKYIELYQETALSKSYKL
jgi:glycosyltransferase involved in cell wall biosynthesis